MKLLLKHNADINSQCKGESREGFTPLHIAIHFNRLEIVKLLLENGANPTITNIQSLTPLEYALEKGNTAIAELIQSAYK